MQRWHHPRLPLPKSSESIVRPRCWLPATWIRRVYAVGGALGSGMAYNAAGRAADVLAAVGVEVLLCRKPDDGQASANAGIPWSVLKRHTL